MMNPVGSQACYGVPWWCKKNRMLRRIMWCWAWLMGEVSR